MNVAHGIHGLGLGGAQQVIKYVVKWGEPQAFRHYVYSPEGGVFHEEMEKVGATVRIIPRHLPKFDPFWVMALSRAMREDAIDVVHTHLFGDSLHGYLAARAAGARPVIMTLHISAEGQTSLQRLGYRWLLKRCARNIACTKSVGESWAREVDVRIDTIVNAVDKPPPASIDHGRIGALRQSLGIASGAVVIGAIGRLVEQKGLHYLIRAFAQLTRSTHAVPQLVLLGDGPLRADLERLAHSQGVGELVKFAGFRSDVAELVHLFDIVAFSSHFEGLPMALLEAMAAARCVVGTDAPGILDAVTPEREALIVPRRDVSRLAEALRRAITDPAMRQRLGQAARQRFLRDFTVERMVSRYEAVYRGVCCQPVQSPGVGDAQLGASIPDCRSGAPR